jgi:hypothetical protein
MTRPSERASESILHPTPLVGALLAVGVIALGASFALLGKAWSWEEILYDLGLSVLIATGVAAAVSRFVQAYERSQQERERNRIRVIKREAEARHAQLARIMEGVDEARTAATEGIAEARLALLQEGIDSLSICLDEVARNLKATRRRVDPGYDSLERALEETAPSDEPTP